MSFWCVYVRYGGHTAAFPPPVDYTRWEDLEIGSVYRDHSLHECWQPKACLPRHSYCYTAQFDECSASATPQQGVVQEWCEADCSEFATLHHKECGCLHNYDAMLFSLPRKGDPCYVPPTYVFPNITGRPENASYTWCTTHSDCLPVDYCASCVICKRDFAGLCGSDCDLGSPNVCDPASNCRPGQAMDSVDGACPQRVKEMCPMGPLAPRDPLKFGGYSRPYCPNELNSRCLIAEMDPNVWSMVPGALLVVVAVTLFETARKRYVKLSALGVASCSCCRFAQLLIVDVAIPMLLLIATFVLAITKSYPMVSIPAGARCWQETGSWAHTTCDGLSLSATTIGSFWMRCWAVAGLFQLAKSFLEFYLLRRIHKTTRLRLDMRMYAVLPEEAEAEGTGAARAVRERQVAVLDLLLSVVLVLTCLLLSIGSLIYGYAY